ncbi:hypothetical protein BSL78_16111, partial [Apostichopus japonicus]
MCYISIFLGLSGFDGLHCLPKFVTYTCSSDYSFNVCHAWQLPSATMMLMSQMFATSPENQATTLNKANEAWKKVKGTPEVSKYKEQADNKNRMEAEGATIRQEHKKVMARHILTEIKKMGVMLMVLLKKQPVQHYVPACRSSLTKNTLVFGQWMQLNPRNTKLCG